jgi:hypothetical protein
VPERVRLGEFRRQAEVATDRGGDRRDWLNGMVPANDAGITCRVGVPAKTRKVETRPQKHDRRDATLLLTLLAEERFPEIWMPSAELRDLRALLRHCDQWVRLRTRVKNALQGPLAHGIRKTPSRTFSSPQKVRRPDIASSSR